MQIQSTQMNLPECNKLSFKGLSPEIIRNQMRIYLCQDVFAEKLKIKMPESEMEKEVLLEVLKNRLQLDKLARLANEKLKLKTKINEALFLIENDSTNPKLEEVKTEIAKKGNLEAVFETMNKNIEKEKKIKKPAVDYFTNISRLEDEYFQKHLITTAKVDRFLKSVKLNNINRNGEYSTQQLIDIVSDAPVKEAVQEQKTVAKKGKISIDKNRFVDMLLSHYEDFMRNHVDIYRTKETSINILKPKAEIYIIEKFKEYFAKFPEVKKQLDKICTSVRLKFLKKVQRFENVDIYNLERIFQEMDSIMSKVKNLQKEINELKSQLENTQDIALKKELLDKEVELTKNKVLWQEYLDTTVSAENENRRRIKAVGCEEEYNYLVEKNQRINQFKELYKTLKDNNDMLPDEVWQNLINAN